MMKVEDLRKQDKKSLLEVLYSLVKEGFSFKMQKANGDLKNHQLVKSNRRNIARVKTILNSKSWNEK